MQERVSAWEPGQEATGWEEGVDGHLTIETIIITKSSLPSLVLEPVSSTSVKSHPVLKSPLWAILQIRRQCQLTKSAACSLLIKKCREKAMSVG